MPDEGSGIGLGGGPIEQAEWRGAMNATLVNIRKLIDLRLDVIEGKIDDVAGDLATMSKALVDHAESDVKQFAEIKSAQNKVSVKMAFIYGGFSLAAFLAGTGIGLAAVIYK